MAPLSRLLAAFWLAAVLLAAAFPSALARPGRGLLAPLSPETPPAHGAGGDHAATAGAATGDATAAEALPTPTPKKSALSHWIQHAAHGASRLLVHSSEMETEAARRAALSTGGPH